ncbi:MAG TPA: glucose 1-dehydrogenase [Acidobacteriaceae bacterium]|nr:glucose 1-dehydrogenase [Acidobacteriaceae bacterium]
MPLLQNKVALITGASSGIGQGIARRFAQEGAKVVIDYIGGPEVPKETFRLVRDAGSEAISVQADISQLSQIRTLVDVACQHFGHIDILVNNAGMEKNAPFHQVTEEDYDKVLAVNLKGPFFLTQYFVQKLLAAKQPGRILNISSVHEEMAFPNFTSYCVSKGGLRMFTRNLAVELGPSNITINNIAPGAIQTPINDHLLHDQPRLDALLDSIPLHRLGQPEDVASLAAFLASDQASYITGSTFIVDGGLIRNYHEQ